MWHLGSNRTTMSGPKSRTGNRARSSPPGPTHRRRPSHRAGAPFSRPQVASRLPAGPSRVFTLVLIRAKGGSRLAPPPLAPATVVAERQLSLGERPGNHGLLDQATEDEPTTAGAASVEAERELLQVGLQVGRGDRALMRAQDPASKEGGDAVHAGHRHVRGIARRGKHSALVHVPVLEQAIVCLLYTSDAADE